MTTEIEKLVSRLADLNIIIQKICRTPGDQSNSEPLKEARLERESIEEILLAKREAEKSQSLPNGTVCKFRMNGLTDSDFDFVMSDLDGMNCEIIDLETYSELGKKDYEYYNLYFPFYGRKRFAVSGYHLTPIVK